MRQREIFIFEALDVAQHLVLGVVAVEDVMLQERRRAGEGRVEIRLDVAREIVGVVSDATVRSLGEAPSPTIYWSLDFAFDRTNFIVRSSGDPSDVLAGMRAEIRTIDPRIMILAASSMEDHLGDTLKRDRLAGSILAGLGGLALLLAMLGIYGVVSFAVSRRRHEVGIRIALGAARTSVVRLFVRDVAIVVAIGALIGGALSIPLGRAAAEVTGAPGSPGTVILVALVLMGASLLATIIPARRATLTDPTDAVRQE